jgi:hypothetical protein
MKSVCILTNIEFEFDCKNELKMMPLVYTLSRAQTPEIKDLDLHFPCSLELKKPQLLPVFQEKLYILNCFANQQGHRVAYLL